MRPPLRRRRSSSRREVTPPWPARPPFGPLTDALGANYINFGIDFSYGGVEGWFDDGDADEFAGVNGAGDVDLLTDVDGRIVSLGTTTQSTTDYFYAEAGFADPGTLTLFVYDTFGALITSVTNDNPLGTHGRTTFSVSTPGIAAFRISGGDTYGVAEIRLNTPGGVPEPGAWALMIMGFGATGAVLRNRRKAAMA